MATPLDVHHTTVTPENKAQSIPHPPVGRASITPRPETNTSSEQVAQNQKSQPAKAGKNYLSPKS